MSQFNILTASNEELLTHITQVVVSTYVAARVLNLPKLPEDAHFEHREAQIVNGLFDGAMPGDEEFARLRNVLPEEHPKYYRDITQLVTHIILSFAEATGIDPTSQQLSLRERALLYATAIDAVQLTVRSAEDFESDDYPDMEETEYSSEYSDE